MDLTHTCLNPINPKNNATTTPATISLFLSLSLSLILPLKSPSPKPTLMAHFTNHRRTVATSEHPRNTSNATLNPTNKSNPTIKTKNPDPVLPSKAFYLPSTFSRLYTSHNNIRTTTSQKPSNTTNYSNVTNNGNAKDNLMQAKVLNVSADFDSSKLQSLINQNQPKISHGPEKVRNKSSSDLVEVKMKKSSSYKEVVKEKKETYKDGVDFEGLDKGNPVSLAVSGRRRRSFGGVQVELSDVFASNGVKVVSVDMAPFMQIHAVDCARKTLDSLEKFSCKTLALTLKKEFDGVYGPAWHCIVGTSFGSFVTHSVGGFMYFSMDQKTYVLLFKTTVQRAD